MATGTYRKFVKFAHVDFDRCKWADRHSLIEILCCTLPGAKQ